MQYVRSDVGPELAKNVGEGVPPQGISILGGQRSCGVVMARIIGEGNPLGDAPA